MPDGDLVLYKRGTHTFHYQRFSDFCNDNGLLAPILRLYGKTPEQAVLALKNADNHAATLLECSLPMAMAILSHHDEYKIVGFLDVAKVERRQGSCSIYYHDSAKSVTNKDTEVKLLVPSLQSMTAIFGANFVKEDIHRSYKYRFFNSYLEIIQFVGSEAKREGLSGYVWVLDETNKERNKSNDRVLRETLGKKVMGGVQREDLFLWAFDRHAQGEDSLNYEIPGMVLLADERQLKEKKQRSLAVHKFLVRWNEFRKSSPDIIESKSLGPFGWTDVFDLQNLLAVSTLIARLADEEVGITKSLLVHKNFFDVAAFARPAEPEGMEALRNLSALVANQLADWSGAATGMPKALVVAARAIKQGEQRARELAEVASEIYKDLDRPGKADPKLVVQARNKIEDICAQALEIENDLRAEYRTLESLALDGRATLDTAPTRKAAPGLKSRAAV
jgi:hypothetical protein